MTYAARKLKQPQKNLRLLEKREFESEFQKLSSGGLLWRMDYSTRIGVRVKNNASFRTITKIVLSTGRLFQDIPLQLKIRQLCKIVRLIVIVPTQANHEQAPDNCRHQIANNNGTPYAFHAKQHRQ